MSTFWGQAQNNTQSRVSRSEQNDILRESRGTAGIRNASATDPFDRYDLDTHEGRDKFFRQTKTDFDAGALGGQQASAAKAMLFHYYGFAMGENLGRSSAALQGSLQSSGANDPALDRALTGYTEGDVATGRERYDLYSNIRVVYDANGAATRARTVDVVRDGRTVTLNWTGDFSTWAGHVGVSADEALRKTDNSVYQAVTNAAFKTDGLTTVSMNGAWRPAFADYRAVYQAQSRDPNANQANLVAMRDVVAQYQARPWSMAHVTSRGLDIKSVNGTNVLGTTYRDNAPTTTEPTVIRSFTDNLLNERGSRQIFQPWRMWTDVPNYLATPVARRDNPVNTGVTPNETRHNNHLHYGR